MKKEDWETIPYDQREAIVDFIFSKITEPPGCSFRKLIYDRLGFEGRSYMRLYQAGGMTITNSMCDYHWENDHYDKPIHEA